MAELGDIRDWARRYEAAWEVQPLIEVVKGVGQRQNGFEISIFAQVEHASPEDVAAIETRVRQIAEAVVPHEGTPLDFEVRSFDDTEYERPETGYAEEVVVPIEVTFGTAHEAPEPKLVAHILASLEARLRELGLKPKAWDSNR
jgi:hypothetical protein